MGWHTQREISMADAQKFEPGAQVAIRSGGPIMTVKEASTDHTTCEWWNDTTSKYERYTFSSTSLEDAPVD